MYISNILDAQSLSKLEKITQQQAQKKSPAISVEKTELRTTSRNGRFALYVSVKIDRHHVSLEEFQAVRKIINPKK